MFTGLIAGVGRLAARETRGGDARMTIAVGSLPFEDVQLGESISVNGCCLTVVEFDAASFAVDASNEALALTTLGRLAIGAPLSLERAMLPTDRLGGHLVSGHVDGLGIAARRWDDARAIRWRITAPMALLQLRRNLADEGLRRVVRIVWNVLRDPGARKRVLAAGVPMTGRGTRGGASDPIRF